MVAQESEREGEEQQAEDEALMANKKKKHAKKVPRVRTSSQSSVEIQVTENEAIITQTTTTTITPSVPQPVVTANSMLCPTPEFLQLLRSVGAEGTETAQGELFTFKMLGFYLKEYIKSQQLWDIYNPLQVHCGDDPLGQVFGVTKFTLEDARLLLLKNAIIVDGGFRKRAAVDGGGWGSPKKRCLSAPCLKDSKKTPSATCTASVIMTTHTSLPAHHASIPTPSSSSSSATKSPCKVPPSPVKVPTNQPTASHSDSAAQVTETATSCDTKSNDTSCPSTGNKQEKCKTKSGKPSSCPEDKPSSFEERESRRRAPSISIMYSDGEAGSGSSPWLLQLQVDESDGTEVLSIMSKETAAVRSSDDDLWFMEAAAFSDADQLDEDSDPPFDEEYEVETGSSSEAESVSSVEEILLVCGDSDMEFWADSESSSGEADYSTDEELSEADKWHCGHCSTLNKPIRRYCDRCCRLRPGWLAGRISRRHRRAQASGHQRPPGPSSQARGQESSSSCVSDKETQPSKSCGIPRLPLTSEMSSFSDSISSSSVSNQDQRGAAQQDGDVKNSSAGCKNSSVSPHQSCLPGLPSAAVGSTHSGSDSQVQEHRLPLKLIIPTPSDDEGKQRQLSCHQSGSDTDTVPVQDLGYQDLLETTSLMESEKTGVVSKSKSFSVHCPGSPERTSEALRTPLHSVQSCPTTDRSCDVRTNFSTNVPSKPGSVPSKPEDFYELSNQTDLPSNNKFFSKYEMSTPNSDAMDRFLSYDSGIGLSLSSITSSQESIHSPVTILTEELPYPSSQQRTPTPLGSPLQTRTCLANFQVSSSPPHTSLYYESKQEAAADGQPHSAPGHSKEPGPTSTTTTTTTTHSHLTPPLCSNFSTRVTAAVPPPAPSHVPAVPASPHPPASASSGDSSQLCTICLSRPKDASLIHGKTGHQVSCYPCGKRLRRRKKPCPVCRRNIQFVIRNFIV